MNKSIIRTILMVCMSTMVTGCVSSNYDQRIVQVKAIPSLDVGITYIGGVFWEVSVKNRSDIVVKLSWDSSAYVDSRGQSSRLIRGETRKLHVAQSQPMSPIPPGSQLSETFTTELLSKHSSSSTLKPYDSQIDGRMYLSFDKDGELILWEGAVEFHEFSQNAVERAHQQWELTKRRQDKMQE